MVDSLNQGEAVKESKDEKHRWNFNDRKACAFVQIHPWNNYAISNALSAAGHLAPPPNNWQRTKRMGNKRTRGISLCGWTVPKHREGSPRKEHGRKKDTNGRKGCVSRWDAGSASETTLEISIVLVIPRETLVRSDAIQQNSKLLTATARSPASCSRGFIRHTGKPPPQLPVYAADHRFGSPILRQACLPSSTVRDYAS